MGLAKYLRAAYKQPKKNLKELYHTRLIQFRRDPATLRLEFPTRIDRARALGYKSKQGVFVVRQRVKRGGHVRKKRSGKKSSRQTTKLILHKNYRQIAEERANRKFVNCEVLNSYWVARDGQHYWFEVIMVDPHSPQVSADKSLSWVKAQRGRAHRGLTSAGRKARGLRWKGKGAEKVRPGRRANKRLL